MKCRCTITQTTGQRIKTPGFPSYVGWLTTLPLINPCKKVLCYSCSVQTTCDFCSFCMWNWFSFSLIMNSAIEFNQFLLIRPTTVISCTFSPKSPPKVPVFPHKDVKITENTTPNWVSSLCWCIQMHPKLIFTTQRYTQSSGDLLVVAATLTPRTIDPSVPTNKHLLTGRSSIPWSVLDIISHV